MHIDEGIHQDEERIRAHLSRAGARALEVLWAPHLLRVEQEPQRACRRLRLFPHGALAGFAAFQRTATRVMHWNDLLQQLQPFPH